MRALGLWSVPTDPSAASGPDRVRAVADRMLALQGQDWNASRWALGVRAPGTTEADVLAAFDSGDLVRSWPMRGTIHVVPSEDIGWMQAATGSRVLAGAPKRRENLGLDEASLTRMTDIAINRLVGGRSISRDELAAAWTEEGIGDPDKGVGPWRYHVIWWLCQNGITVPGPVSAADAGSGASAKVPEPRLVLAEEWIPTPRKLKREEALAELAARFALGHGPVQERDLVWWTGLPVRQARAGITAAAAEGRIAPVEVDGTTYWADPALLAEAPGAPADDDALLLPSFDEHLLGYTDRSAVLDSSHIERIVPGRNGMFRATIVDGGRVVGVWMRTPRTKHTRIEVEALPGERVDLSRLHGAAAAWGAFRETETELTLSVKI